MSNCRAVYRISTLIILLGLCYTWDWMPLRVALRDVIVWLIRALRYNAISFIYDGSPALRVEGKLHYYSPECTYIVLVMIVLPFVWVFGVNHRSNILRIAITVLCIVGINLIRCWAAVYLDVLGVDKFYAHDVPNYAIGISIVAGAVLSSLRRDCFNHCAFARNYCETHGTSEIVICRQPSQENGSAG